MLNNDNPVENSRMLTLSKLNIEEMDRSELADNLFTTLYFISARDSVNDIYAIEYQRKLLCKKHFNLCKVLQL